MPRRRPTPGRAAIAKGGARRYVWPDGKQCAVVLSSCHPFISGRASRVLLLEELVGYIRKFRGVWFTTGEEVARWHAARPGVG